MQPLRFLNTNRVEDPHASEERFAGGNNFWFEHLPIGSMPKGRVLMGAKFQPEFRLSSFDSQVREERTHGVCGFSALNMPRVKNPSLHRGWSDEVQRAAECLVKKMGYFWRNLPQVHHLVMNGCAGFAHLSGDGDAPIGVDASSQVSQKNWVVRGIVGMHLLTSSTGRWMSRPGWFPPCQGIFVGGIIS